KHGSDNSNRDVFGFYIEMPLALLCGLNENTSTAEPDAQAVVGFLQRQCGVRPHFDLGTVRQSQHRSCRVTCLYSLTEMESLSSLTERGSAAVRALDRSVGHFHESRWCASCEENHENNGGNTRRRGAQPRITKRGKPGRFLSKVAANVRGQIG